MFHSPSSAGSWFREDLVDADAHSDALNGRRAAVLHLVRSQPLIDSLKECLAFNGKECLEFPAGARINGETQRTPFEPWRL